MANEKFFRISARGGAWTTHYAIQVYLSELDAWLTLSGKYKTEDSAKIALKQRIAQANKYRVA